ncbi:MAG: gamma-glutamyl-gamma-aminobutyrate hydrolase family protein [Tissierellia bacterium]|nr:gamma-glutamyl-gamma-aminobutyrate hydrolase family protein [Tissierellia bacterium]
MKRVLLTDRYIPTDEMLYYNRLKHHYAEAVLFAGGLPFIAPTSESLDRARAYVDMADALIFTGGEDISPLLYNEDFHPKVKQISFFRDDFESAIFREAMAQKKPILGICRGMQLINALMGGSLYQDIESQVPGASNHNHDFDITRGILPITIEEGSYLYEDLGAKAIVNQEHHQAVKDPAPGFKVTARTRDGIIQAMEYEGDQFIHLVQFHPESMVQRQPEFLEIFIHLLRMTK